MMMETPIPTTAPTTIESSINYDHYDYEEEDPYEAGCTWDIEMIEFLLEGFFVIFTQKMVHSKQHHHHQQQHHHHSRQQQKVRQ